MINTSIQQINPIEALIQVENYILAKDSSILRYLKNRCKYDESMHGYIVELQEVSFLKDKINFHISGKQKKKKLSEIPNFVQEAFQPIQHILEVKNSKGVVIQNIPYRNDLIAEDLGLSQQHISDAVQMAFQLRGRVLLADDPGLNSCQAAVNIAYAYNYKIPFLIVCSSTQRQKWKTILKQQFNLKDSDIQILYNDSTQFDFKRDAIIVTYEQAVRRKQELQDIKVVLVDEAHYLRNIKFVTERELMEYLCLRKRVVLLSNSCVIQSVEDLFPILRVVRPDCFYNQNQFKERYFNNENTWIELNRLLKHVGMIRRTISMFDTAQQINNGFVAIESNRVITSVLNKLLFTANRSRGILGKSMYSQCYSLTLDAKIQGCLSFIDKQLELKSKDKIVVFGYHQKTFELVSDHLLSKKISFLNIDKKINYNDKQNILQSNDIQERVVLMSFTNIQDVELSQFSTAIILELSWHPHLVESAVGCLQNLHQVNDKVDIFILEGIDTLDKMLKGKYFKWLDMKNRILDGKKGENNVNSAIKDFIPQEENIGNQEHSIDLEFNQDQSLRNRRVISTDSKMDKNKKQRQRKNISDKLHENKLLKINEKKIKDNSCNNNLLQNGKKLDIQSCKKNFLQKARLLDSVRRKFYSNEQKEIIKDDPIVIDDDIENFTQDRSHLNQDKAQVVKNHNLIQDESKEQIYISDVDSNNEEYEQAEENSEVNGKLQTNSNQYVNDEFDQDFNSNISNNKKFLDQVNCDFDLLEFEEQQIHSNDLECHETPIHKFQSQRSDSHISLYKNIIQKINVNVNDTNSITHDEDFYKNDFEIYSPKKNTAVQNNQIKQDSHNKCNSKQKNVSKNNKNINIKNDKSNNNKRIGNNQEINIINHQQNNLLNNKILIKPLKEKESKKDESHKKLDEDLDYILRELEIECDFNIKPEENLQQTKELMLNQQNVIEVDDQLVQESGLQFIDKVKQTKNKIIEENNFSSNEEGCIKNQGNRNKQGIQNIDEEIEQTNNKQYSKNLNSKQSTSKQNNFKNLIEEEFIQQYATVSKQSVMTKCSTMDFPIEITSKKDDHISFFDKYILGIDDTKNSTKKNEQNQDHLEFNELLSLKGSNAIGFDVANLKKYYKQEQQKNSINKNPYKTQELFSDKKTNEANPSITKQTIGQQKRFTGLKKKQENLSFKYDPKSQANRKKVKVN